MASAIAEKISMPAQGKFDQARLRSGNHLKNNNFRKQAGARANHAAVQCQPIADPGPRPAPDQIA
jgi:hypothetical protein